MVTKYFVEVIASNKQQLINLQKFELDLFQSTAKSIDDKEFKIDRLISLKLRVSLFDITCKSICIRIQFLTLFYCLFVFYIILFILKYSNRTFL
jgi:hypothetical protein